MTTQWHHSAIRQHGSVLIVALMLLLVLTILGVTAMNNMTLEQRMAVGYQRAEEAFQAAQDETNDEMGRWNKPVLEAAGKYNELENYIYQAYKLAEAATEERRCSTPHEKDRDVVPNAHNAGTRITVNMSTVYQGGKIGTLLTPECDSCVAEAFNITADARVSAGTATLGRSAQTTTVTWFHPTGDPLGCPSATE